VDDGAGRHIGPSDAITIGNVAPGNHTVGLSNIAANCSVNDNPQSVDVVAGAANDLTFAISCVAPSGSIEVSVSTAGDQPDPDGYLLTLDGAAPARPIGINGTETFADVPPGNHEVELGNVASNCTPADFQRAAAVTANQTSSISFDVACVATGP